MLDCHIIAGESPAPGVESWHELVIDPVGRNTVRRIRHEFIQSERHDEQPNGSVI